MSKVLILNHNQERFGTYFRCYFIGEGLSKLGHNVIMICSSGNNFDIKIRKLRINNNFSIITLPRIKYGKYFSGQIFLRLPLYLYYVIKGNYDYLYAFTVAQPQIGIPVILGKILRKKIIIDWDDLWGGGFAKEHGRFIEKILTWFERNIIKIADKVTYVSEYIGNEIEKIDPKIVKNKIDNGANVKEIDVIEKMSARKKLNYKKDELLAISIGNTYTASFKIMLKAFKLVLESIPNMKLLLIGNVVIKDEYKSLFNSLRYNVIIVGSKPYSEMKYYMGVADVLLLPMDNDPVEWARFPMRFGDYLCAERPIVSNAVGVVKFYLEKFNAGLVSGPKSENEFANNIVKVIINKKLALLISKNARKLSNNELSREKIILKLSKFIFEN